MHFFESAGLELFARVAGERRPAEDLARDQRGNADWPARRHHFQRNVPGDQQVEQAGMIAFVEDQFPGLKMDFAGHRRQPRDVIRPESLAERMLLQKGVHDLAHSTSQKWWRRFFSNFIIGPFGMKCKCGGASGLPRSEEHTSELQSP